MSLEAKGIPLKEIEQVISFGAAPGCSIAVAIPNNGLESISFGRFGEPGSPEVNSHTIYDLASITKLFTTALVLRLHESGKLSVNDLCAKYLDNFLDSEVTVRDLLTHKVDFDIRLSDYRTSNPNRESLNNALMVIKPPSKPSLQIHYANLGFIYLGKIIEKLEGKDLNGIMNNLFQELELKETYTGVDIAKLGIIAPPTEIIGSQVIQSTTHDETSRLLGGIAGNAGVFSSAEDLVRFGKAWLEGKVITSDGLKQIIFSNYDTSGLKPQAIGWWLRVPTLDGEVSTQNLYTHIGFTGSILAINTQSGKVCTFTCNRTYYGRENNRHKEIWELLTDWAQK